MSSLNFNYRTIITLLVLNGFGILGHHSEIVYNLAKIGSSSNKISANCRHDLTQTVKAINDREIWALKLLDSSGKFGSGFTWGNNYLLGDQFGCGIVNKPIYISQTRHLNPINHPNLLTERSPFPVEYRMIYIRHTSELQFDLLVYDRKILHLGVCFPRSCENEDTMELAQNYFYHNVYDGREMVGDNVTVLRTKTLQLRDNFWSDTFVRMLILITIFNVVNIAIGTIYMHNVQQNRLGLAKKNDDNAPVKAGLVERWFSSFSLIENTKLIFSLSISDDSIKSVHGIRALGMFWLIAGHVVYFSAKMADNLEIQMKFGDIWYYQPITTDFLGVDIFIVMGAFLLSFLYFERQKIVQKETGLVLVIKSIVLRYIRLTPLHFVVILVTYTVTIYFEDTTPFEMLEDYEKNCNERYWLNLLYINNLFPLKNSCLSWAWYLANDFQCLLVAIIVLVVFSRNKKLGIWLGTGISLACMAISMYFAAQVKFSFALDNYFNTGDVMYSPPWNRIAAYFVAVVAGWYFSKNNRQLHLSKFYIVLGWILAETILFGTVFLHVFKEHNPVWSVLYSGFGRILWSIATCWIIIACASNNGGFVTKILELKIWIPFSRMSFACYLINPIAIISIFMLSETSYHVSLCLLLIESIGFIVFCFLGAYFLMVIYEIPFNKLLRTFIEKKK